MTFTILVLVVLAVLAAAFFGLTRRETAAVRAREPEVADDDRVVSDPVPVNGSAQVSEPDRITWTKQFDPRSGALDDAARLRLLEDLALLRAPWSVPILEQASREERDPAHRDAAQRALALCREAGSSKTQS